MRLPTLAQRAVRIWQRQSQQRAQFLAGAGDAADQHVCTSPRLFRRTAVFFGISCTTVAAAAWITNEQTNYWVPRTLKVTDPAVSDFSVWDEISLERLEVIDKFAKKLRAVLPSALYDFVDYPASLASHAAGMHDSLQFFLSLVAVNASVYALSWIPSGCFVITRYMMHSGFSGRSYTLFTGNFVHVGAMHLLCNLGCTWLISHGFVWIAQQEGPLQWTISWPKLVAFWTLAGGFGYFVPNMAAVVLQRGLIKCAPRTMTVFGPLPEVFFHSLRPSLGASSAVHATATVSAFALGPDSLFHFGPISCSPQQLLGTCLLVEALSWPFNPAAAPHLTGALFGYLYVCWGQQAWEWSRRMVGNQRVFFTSEDRLMDDGRVITHHHLKVSPPMLT